MWKWFAALFFGALNAGLAAALNFDALCPPHSKAFALVSIGVAVCGFVLMFLKSPVAEKKDDGHLVAGKPDLKVVE